MKKKILQVILLLVLIQLIFISCAIPVDFEDDSKKEGKFKIVNSWGTSRYRDNPDRFFYITYDFLKNLGQKGMYAITLEAESDYEPQAVAVFEMKHPSRSDCSYKIIKGDVSDPEKIKVLPISEGAYFPNSLYYLFKRNQISKGIDMEFPKGLIVVDISELLPLNNQSITLEVTDRNPSYKTGEVTRFWIETYERQYDLKRQNNLTKYKCENLPVKTENSDSIYVTIPNLTIEKNNNYSIYALSEEPLLKRTKNETKLPLWWDNSESVYFPPVGSQAMKGACAVWSLAYYVAGFNEARKHGWDLSNSTIDTVDKSKVLSPDFVYLLTMDYDFEKQEAEGSNRLMVCKLLAEIGCCTWDKMPYDSRGITS